MIKILIADDHTIVRDGLRLILETAQGMEVVAEAENGRQALRLAAEAQPDVILMDLRMPEMDGLTAIGYLAQEQPQIPVIILTTYDEDDLIRRGLQAGARGYLLKDMSRETLIRTIEAAARGETLIHPQILQRALTPSPEPSPEPSPPQTTLTDRELEVLRAASTGQTNQAIGLALGISERTVKAHLTNVYNKLGVDSRAAAMTTAARLGLL
jgi:NarL family two-component system response regulator YdfI